MKYLMEFDTDKINYREHEKAEIYFFMGKVCLRLEKNQESALKFQQCLNIEKDHYGALMCLANLMMKMGAEKGALNYYAACIELNS